MKITIKPSTASPLRSLAKIRPANAMTEQYVAQIEAYAQRDAKAGVYMSPGYIAMERAYMETNVSPDRAGAIAKAKAQMNKPGPKEEVFDWFCEMLDIPYEGRVQRGLLGTYAQIYDENGEMIAAYTPNGSGWTTVPTKAEENFQQTANQIYCTAYKAAKQSLPAKPAVGQTFSLSV